MSPIKWAKRRRIERVMWCAGHLACLQRFKLPRVSPTSIQSTWAVCSPQYKVAAGAHTHIQAAHTGWELLWEPSRAGGGGGGGAERRGKERRREERSEPGREREGEGEHRLRRAGWLQAPPLVFKEAVSGGVISCPRCGLVRKYHFPLPA